MDFSNKMYLYFDAAALRDPGAEQLMEILAKHYRQMILFVADVWEEEALKQLPAYGFICRTVYGHDLQRVLDKDSAKRSLDKAKHIMILTESTQTLDGILVVHLHRGRGLKQILQEKLQWDKKRRTIVAGICMGCIAYFTAYFLLLDTLPLWMQDGGIAFLLCLLPAEVLVLTILYGLCKKVISLGAIFEFLDFFG